MFEYEEACPISKASSILCERWTLQILREMFMGATRFNEFRTYLPKMSPSLLNARLKMLEEQGLIMKKKLPEKKNYEYVLTPSGNELKPVLKEIGRWGMKWVFDSMAPEELNFSVLVRDFATKLNMEYFPGERSTLQFNLLDDDQPLKEFVHISKGEFQLCSENSGFDVDIYVSADIATYGAVWFGKLSIVDAMKTKKLSIVGANIYVQQPSKWMGVSDFSCLD